MNEAELMELIQTKIYLGLKHISIQDSNDNHISISVTYRSMHMWDMHGNYIDESKEIDFKKIKFPVELA